MFPKHIEHIPNKDRRAVAPYNFVELPEQIVKVTPPSDNNRYHSDKITGKISCELTTASPLYIRGGFSTKDFAKHGDQPSSTDYLRNRNKVSEEEQSHRSDFFAYPNEQKPVIPGSSLRGMIRSLIEIVGYGKIDKVSDSSLVYRAVADTTSLKDHYRDRFVLDNTFQQQAGYLHRRGSEWVIQPAVEIQGKPFARISNRAQQPSSGSQKPTLKKNAPKRGNNRKISFKLTGETDYTGLPIVEWVTSGGTDGQLVKTGDIPKKKYNCVFGVEDTDRSKEITVPYDMVEKYRDQITKEQVRLLGKHENAALKDGQPIFYLIENDELTFFGHAMMFRLPYPSSVKEFIPAHLRSSEENDNIPDISEAIFGYVRDQKRSSGQALKSRVFFSDAKCLSNNDIWLKNQGESLVPHILSSPKPTTFQHYLVQPKNTEAHKESLKHYHSKPVEDTVIRGHKLYWHKGKVTVKHIEADVKEASSQHTEIKPVNTGVRFGFDVHFENLSNVELGVLLWVLDIAQNERHRLSLGMGKPLGMGAIQITHTLHIDHRAERYQQLFDNSYAHWNQPKATEHQNYVQSFEAYMTQQLGIESNSFKQQTRIRMLLEMLAWTDELDDAQKQRLRYMTIQPNDYVNRPVLPTPLDIDDTH